MESIFASIVRSHFKRILTGSNANPGCTSSLQLQVVRLASGRRDCNPDGNEPRCSKLKLKGSPCEQKKVTDKSKPKTPFKSMWDNPECCKDPCPDSFPRFDDLYYRISDKAKRKYMQTWAECPKCQIRPKFACKISQMPLEPPFVKRKKTKRPKTACKPTGCGLKQSIKCTRISLPGCIGRYPPKCHVVRKPSSCKKVCSPYPSFSECKKSPKVKKRRVECSCLRSRSQCTMFDYLRKLLTKKKR